ncbi:MAG: DUF6444 domain-containing protein [Pseudonocardiaceae bacterium]
MSAPEPPEPSYRELAVLVAGLAARVGTLEAENATLVAENAELRRRLGMNSTNSSTPPSKDSIGAKAKRRADRSSRERSKERKPGGQPGRKGSGQGDRRADRPLPQRGLPRDRPARRASPLSSRGRPKGGRGAAR